MAGTILNKTAIPYDGSDAAECALEIIAPLLKATDGVLHIVMVLDQYVQNQLREFATVEGLTGDQAALVSCERMQAAAVDHGLTATFAIVSDAEVVEGMVGAAKDAGCTAIALPTHGFKGVTRWFMGNLRDKIVQSAGLPVLVLPPVEKKT